ncbi:hypothetical protein BJ165DRAFT_1479874 [Panaeolus papilionaceus]|nr:hypothetical protein BJ165DRAFT_1479874 [Panaeolus papilionaceus]
MAESDPDTFKPYLPHETRTVLPIPVTHRLKDEPCFVTNKRAMYPGHLRRTYLIDARPDPKDETAEDRVRKQRVIDRMQYLGIVGPDFTSLEHKSNSIMLSTHLHKQQAGEFFGVSAIVPSKETLLKMIDIVEASNTVWAVDREGDPECARKPFNLMDPALANPTYQVLALEPKTMLKGVQLTVYADEMYTTPVKVSLWKDYLFLCGGLREVQDGTQLPSNPTPLFGAFPRRHNREPSSDNSNPFLHVVSAHIILRRYKRARKLYKDAYPELCSEYEELIELTCRLSDMIYFDVTPKELTDEEQESWEINNM